MSVQVLDIQVFNYLRAGLLRAAYNSTVNDFYFSSVSRHFKECTDFETEAENIVKNWCDLNELCFCEKYKKHGEKFQQLSQFIQPTFTHKPLESIQFIKYIQCLVYNIEPEYLAMTEQQSKYLQLLKTLQIEAMAAYIDNLEEYKNANWSN